MGDDGIQRTRSRPEPSAVQRCGLRWAVLAAWHEELERRGAFVPPHIVERLEASRARIASGCFAKEALDGELLLIEAGLAPADAACEPSCAGFWRELLGHALADDDGIARLLGLPAVRLHFAGCGGAPPARENEA